MKGTGRLHCPIWPKAPAAEPAPAAADPAAPKPPRPPPSKDVAKEAISANWAWVPLMEKRRRRLGKSIRPLEKVEMEGGWRQVEDERGRAKLIRCDLWQSKGDNLWKLTLGLERLRMRDRFNLAVCGQSSG